MLALGSLLAVQPAIAQPAIAQPAVAEPSCRLAAAAAERRWWLPPNLLLAIGTVESGRARQDGGPPQPWPWTADAGGHDYVFGSAAEAVAVVGFLQQRGIESIDVGCFQVNLHYHPAAFANLTAGFDVDANANYAAFLLRSLFERSGNWDAAIAAYHSADPALGGPYRSRVQQVWQGLGVSEAVPSTVHADPHVILATTAAMAIPIYTAATLPPLLRAVLGLSGTGLGGNK